MTRVQVWVEIPDGYELACDEMREPQQGEYFVDTLEQVRLCVDKRGRDALIVRSAWQWPSWLKAAAIAMDEDGVWFTHAINPVLREGYWHSGDSRTLSRGHFDFTPPPCTDWRKSLRLNPNREVKS